MSSDPTATVSLDAAYAECERLAGRDKPHLYAAAHLFERPEVRRAFVATYASMRLIDDAIDGIPHRARLTDGQREHELSRVANWLGMVETSHRGGRVNGLTWLALSDTFSRFAFPLDPWVNLGKAMSSDVVASSFETWEDLRHYMQGASVAPAIVFMYLVLMRPAQDGVFRTDWSFGKVHAATEDLAIFCYCVHILRDVAVDLELGESGHIYLPRQELRRFGLTDGDLYSMREKGHGNDAFVDLAAFQAVRAREHLALGRAAMSAVLAEAEPSNGRALTTLVDTYERILNDLQDRNFDVFGKLAAVK